MEYYKNIIIGWLAYIGILFIELLVDFSLRKMANNFYDGGLPEWLWFLIQIIAALVGAYYIFNATSTLHKTIHQVFSYTVNIFFGVVVYIAIIYSYVLGFGIDSF